MKKYLYLLLIVSLILVISGCGKKSIEKKGNTIKFEFSSNSSAGEYVDIEESTKGIVSIKSESPNKDRCEGRAGCSFTTYYIISGLKEGNTTITFTKKHVHGNILRKIAYNITVDKDLNITETHTEENND